MKLNFLSWDLSFAALLRSFVLIITYMMVVSCSPQISPTLMAEHTQAPADFPINYYLQAKAAGSTILRIDSNRSLVVLDVRRGGAFARLGHDHVVASRDVTGYVNIKDGRADLYVAVDRLTVDEPALRTEAGLTATLSAGAIEGTRRNMLDKVLESGRFPFALIRITRGTGDHSALTVAISLHGTMKTFEVPAQIETLAGGLNISGQMTFNQSDFGITPFSILGGAIQVQDRLDLRFRIIATAS
jgi:hypothetical protein